jgi:hypothetical protein
MLQRDQSVPPGGTSSVGLALPASSNSSPAQTIYFDNLLRASAFSQKSPLSFHTLTHSFFCNHFSCTYLRKYPGVTPCFHNSNGINIFLTNLTLRTILPAARSLPAAAGNHAHCDGFTMGGNQGA